MDPKQEAGCNGKGDKRQWGAAALQPLLMEEGSPTQSSRP